MARRERAPPPAARPHAATPPRPHPDVPPARTAGCFGHPCAGPPAGDEPLGELGRVAAIEPAAHHLARGHVGEPGAERLPVGLLLLGQLPPHQRSSLTWDRISSTA